MDALLLLGPAGQSPATTAAYAALVAPLATRLGLATTACHLVFRETDALAAVNACIAAGQRRIIVLPLALEAEEITNTKRSMAAWTGCVPKRQG